MKMMKIEDIVRLATPVLDRHACDAVQTTFRREGQGWVLRILIERRGADLDVGSGVDHRLCSSVSRDVAAILDAEGAIEQKYMLEVSSPGLDRPLTRPQDYARFAGRLVSVHTSRAFEGARRFRGVLAGLEQGVVLLKDVDGKDIAIPVDLIMKANLVFEPKRLGAN
ncbi:MAG: ribosome maturation factor RimP [Deltaproteobacteria bacterium]|nr:ribosome maturation factor RimP [Deltaproteobacteria bacterium]